MPETMAALSREHVLPSASKSQSAFGQRMESFSRLKASLTPSILANMECFNSQVQVTWRLTDSNALWTRFLYARQSHFLALLEKELFG